MKLICTTGASRCLFRGGRYLRTNRLWAVGEDCLIVSKSKPIDRPIYLSDQTIILYKESDKLQILSAVT